MWPFTLMSEKLRYADIMLCCDCPYPIWGVGAPWDDVKEVEACITSATAEEVFVHWETNGYWSCWRFARAVKRVEVGTTSMGRVASWTFRLSQPTNRQTSLRRRASRNLNFPQMLAVPTLKRLSPAFKTQYQCESRKLLRALLRECTYLPDSFARQQIAEQLLSRFRTSQSKGCTALETATNREESPRARHKALNELNELQKKGHKALRRLQRANDGEIKPLLNVLHYTYGRAGKRRHELLAPLLVPDEPAADAIVMAERAQKPTNWDLSTVPLPDIFDFPRGTIRDTINYRVSERYGKLRSLLVSQIRSPPPDEAQTRLKMPGFSMPAKNIWARPMPRKRVKNMARKKRAEILSKALPPLPEHEWNRLQGLIAGTIRWEGPVPRRKRVTAIPDPITSFDVEKVLRLRDASKEGTFAQSYTPSSESGLENAPDLTQQSKARTQLAPSDAWLLDETNNGAVIQQMLEDDLKLLHLNKRTVIPGLRGHQITHRFMKRLWLKVFQQCPLMTQIESSGKWQVTWGFAPEQKPNRDLSAFSMLFDVPTQPTSRPASQKQPKRSIL
jgi:hypothetical protein